MILVTIWWQQINSITIEWLVMILVVIDWLGPFSVAIWEPSNGNRIIVRLSNANQFSKRFLRVCEF
jgi:hypothetical protein